VKNLLCVTRGSLGKPVQNALGELEEQLKARGINLLVRRFWDKPDADTLPLIAGQAGESLVNRVAAENGLSLPTAAETIAIHSCKIGNGQEALLVSGGDAAGLMYGIYELADRIRCGGIEALRSPLHTEEAPGNRVRGVDRYIMNHLDEEWFCSAEFWDSFLKKLARNRFNRFTLITGFDTSYLTPPYPFFVEVPGFESIRVKGLTPEKRNQNLETLRGIARKCEEWGILFSFASWQQRPWTDNQELLTENIPGDDAGFTRYCAGGIRAILEACPGIGAVQFRVNMEAGITGSASGGTNTHESFWNAIIDAIAEVGRPVKLDLRAKGVTDLMVAHGLASGLDVSIPTKYWCEHAALPYHISKLRAEESRHLENMNSSRRYSYGNLLKKPRWYDMIYRLWNYGSINLFLWADPDYCSRFSKSMDMGGGAGFEINSPLSLKGGMEDYAGAPWKIHRDPALINYRWEDERYWAFYLVFGRYGYSAHTCRDVVLREFTARFGTRGPALLAAYESAGKVMPLITTIHFPVHPSLHYWPELYPGAALFTKNNYDNRYGEVNYATALPGDEELFYSIAAYVEDHLAKTPKAKYSPLLLRDRLHDLALEIRSRLDQAACSQNSRGEELALWVDFTMIALIADFHAWKSAAAYYLYLYQKLSGTDRLIAAHGAMLQARRIWAELSGLGSRYYHHDLQFNAGTGMARHKSWQERLEKEIDPDLRDLEALLEEAGEKPEILREKASGDYYHLAVSSPLRLSAQVPEIWDTGRDLEITARAEGDEAPRQVLLNYRHTDHTEGEYRHVPMDRRGGEYRALIPGGYFTQGYDVIVYLSAIDAEGRAVIYPGIYHPDYPAPYFVVKSGGLDNLSC
jgi:hypothetical protein